MLASQNGGEEEEVLAQGYVPSLEHAHERMPLPIATAYALEVESQAPEGAHFIAVAHQRIKHIIQLHERWQAKCKNRRSMYAPRQKNLQEFFERMLKQFETEYSDYVKYSFMGITRTRARKKI